ncbi:hypothetical protein J1605_004986 [Eschrichtius robustus]|uniref:T-cell surface glycoprotein CD3 zeta chain n=1 Tax=Eschrichtius robustus TaxID=9764 RepID=A0AB34HA66_ESCRO|nr:hypothetical protein J1605_004986 [Eschrichtius robustus]
MLSAHFTSAYLVDDSVMTGGLGNTWNPGSRFSQALASRRGTKFVVGIAVSMLAGNLLAMSKHKLQAGSPFVPSVLTSDPLREVPEYAGPALLKLQPAFPPAAQSFGLLDPKLCYLLDGILFIYGVIVTALFLRAKFSRSADVAAYQQGQNQVYNELNLGRREEYDVLDRRGGLDPEMGGKPRKKNPHEVVYNELRKDKMAEAYSELGMKGENQRRRGKGHDGLYQCQLLSTAGLGKPRAPIRACGDSSASQPLGQGWNSAIQAHDLVLVRRPWEPRGELGTADKRQLPRGCVGLSTATKDTYAALHLQDLPPR